MCGHQWAQIPAKLPAPKSEKWLSELREVLTLEKFSLAQYEADRAKYQAPMPYHMVIPQEEDHIRWIRELFTAYGMKSDGSIPKLKQSSTVTQAYQIAMQLEEELIPKYENLIQKAEDQDSARVLNSILYQTRMHLMMFSHALRMGGRMGPGMMGPGMMHRGR
jgi:rubrerythrin